MAQFDEKTGERLDPEVQRVCSKCGRVFVTGDQVLVVVENDTRKYFCAACKPAPQAEQKPEAPVGRSNEPQRGARR